MDNILLVVELVRDYNRSIEPGSVMLKIDIRKAFDTLNWDFTIQILRAIGLTSRFVYWIASCITTTKFSVVINDELTGFFRGQRGLRQGDPLSLYLFILAMDVFSHMLDASAKASRIKSHLKCIEPMITHLAFADDVMIFTEADPVSISEIMRIIEEFGKMSWLHVNRDKYDFFSEADSINRRNLIVATGMKEGTLPVRYLEVPLSPWWLTSGDFQPLIDRIRSKVSGWTARFLSSTDKEDIWDLLEIPLGNGQSESANARVAWDNICMPKKEGGLGPKKLTDVNLRRGFWDTTPNPRRSWNLRKLLRLKEVVRPFIKIQLGNGRTISFWHDSWSSLGPLIEFIGDNGPSQLRIERNATVTLACKEGYWNMPGARNDKIQQLHSELTTVIPPKEEMGEDVPLWKHKDDTFRQIFSSTKTWELIRVRGKPKHGTV
ncbi:PREDICTED: uncharacterized protein LOC109116119 [Tarenaya hassleriana]|uniref:uncharacterized protein LOC109116119 n=1 Tax=Tarenaya hassleriana TaxID=28532 RepID=UPI0008FD8156|nr:PREDICTED: uncharacterized protein LOC109116119 [Tarenaya hassleriana]